MDQLVVISEFHHCIIMDHFVKVCHHRREGNEADWTLSVLTRKSPHLLRRLNSRKFSLHCGQFISSIWRVSCLWFSFLAFTFQSRWIFQCAESYSRGHSHSGWGIWCSWNYIKHWRETVKCKGWTCMMVSLFLVYHLTYFSMLLGFSLLHLPLSSIRF